MGCCYHPQGSSFAPGLLGGMSVEAFNFIATEDPSFIDSLDVGVLQLLSDEVFSTLPESVQELALAGEIFIPENPVTRVNGSPSLSVTIFKKADSNTVTAFYEADDVIRRIDENNPNVEVGVAFQQSEFVEQSVQGVVSSGALGAIFATVNILIFLSGGFWGRSGRTRVGAIVTLIFVILLSIVILAGLDTAGGDLGLAFANADTVLRILLILGIVAGLFILVWPAKLPYPSWRPTLVIGVSIPLSILSALAIMYWVPPLVHGLLGDAVETSAIANFIGRVFPENLTLNIMTLSGLTVAIGRLVDDSIVVLENIFRQMQSGMDKREAILSGVRDVSVAIFSATSIAVVVFLPLGLVGGLIGEFFLPFAAAVTYTLLSSFLVAITVVPVLAFLFISPEHVPEESESVLQRLYIPVLRWALSGRTSKIIVLLFALFAMMAGGALLGSRPAAFLPEFGESQVTVAVSLPPGTKILTTNEQVLAFEQSLPDIFPEGELRTVQTIIGGGTGLESLIGGGTGVAENAAELTISVNSQETITDTLIEETKLLADSIFGEGNTTVAKSNFTSQGGFGGFELVVSAPSQDILEQFDSEVLAAINSVDGISEASSSLEQVAAGGDDAPASFLRIDGEPALSYSGELETQDTINIVPKAIEAVEGITDLPDTVTVSQGFDSELQSEGFAGIIVTMGIAIAIVVVILIFVFRSPFTWLALILSVAVAPVGAAVALTITNSVLGISAMIGLLMLIGLVVTNAIVLIDRVRANRIERDMELYDALIEAGNRRLRPILMTAIATIIALIPLAVGLSQGAVIADQLGIAVIGGVFSSTLLTLIVVPVAYSLLTPLHDRVFGRGKSK